MGLSWRQIHAWRNGSVKEWKKNQKGSKIQRAARMQSLEERACGQKGESYQALKQYIIRTLRYFQDQQPADRDFRRLATAAAAASCPDGCPDYPDWPEDDELEHWVVANKID